MIITVIFLEIYKSSVIMKYTNRYYNLRNTNYIHNIHNNSGNINQYFANNLKVAPTKVEFKATKSYTGLNILLLIISISIFFPIAKLLHTLIKNTNIIIFIGTLSGSTLFIILIELTNKMMLKYSIGNVAYKNLKVTIDGTIYSFYKDIWDIKYSKSILNIFFNSATLIFYIISPSRKIPISYKIKFEHDAKAKYIYDLFHTKIRE